jgi:hypothetical protein
VFNFADKSRCLVNLYPVYDHSDGARRLIQGGTIDLVKHPLSCNDQLSIKIAE